MKNGRWPRRCFPERESCLGGKRVRCAEDTEREDPCNTPNYPKLINSNNCFRFFLVIQPYFCFCSRFGLPLITLCPLSVSLPGANDCRCMPTGQDGSRESAPLASILKYFLDYQ